jgi:hypothetical protein
MIAKSLVTAAAVMAVVAPAWGQTPRLQGTWRLDSSITEKDGTKTDQFGSAAAGMMTLDAGGRFMLTIIGPDLPKFAANNRAAGTPEENRAVVGKSIAMLGTYSVSEKTLIFKVERATFPNWDGTEQRRVIVTADGNELKYVTANASGGGTAIVTWQRAR